MSSTTKRQRQSSSSSSSSTATAGPTSSPSAKSSGTSKPQHHPAKSFRILSPGEVSPGARTTGEGNRSHPIVCTLPPTCTHRPTPLANTKELESHYATYHAHVCEQNGCGCVFPEAILLELHFTECHDPLAAVKKERGEKIFGCHQATCKRLFMTPKSRRLHLIEGHKYPKEYFFAVTNKGVGGLLQKWGEGASMIRKEWKAREAKGDNKADDSDEEAGSESSAEDGGGNKEDVDEELMAQMNALSLVPQTVRFGRGGTQRGLGWRGRGRAGIMKPHRQ
ncbi:hypothetical protein JOM56_007701 [Amanita muscaria]